MPAAPKRPCSRPGCGNYRPCPQHEGEQRKQHDQARGSSRERGYGTRWDKYSRWFRQQVECPECGKNHAVCERCHVELSEMVDHVIPVQGESDPRFWDHANHQGLSRNCHAIKTAEDVRKGLTR